MYKSEEISVVNKTEVPEIKLGVKTYGAQQIDIEIGWRVLEAICARDKEVEALDTAENPEVFPLYDLLLTIRGIERADYDLTYDYPVICLLVTHGCDNPLTWGKVQRTIQEYLYPGSVEEIKYGSIRGHVEGWGDTGACL